MLVFVTAGTEVSVDLSRITLNGKAIGTDTEVRAMIESGEETISYEDGVAQMPGYSVLVLK